MIKCSIGIEFTSTDLFPGTYMIQTRLSLLYCLYLIQLYIYQLVMISSLLQLLFLCLNCYNLIAFTKVSVHSKYYLYMQVYAFVAQKYIKQGKSKKLLCTIGNLIAFFCINTCIIVLHLAIIVFLHLFSLYIFNYRSTRLYIH